MSDLFSVTDRLTNDLGPRQHELADPVTGHISRFKFIASEATKCPRWAAERFAAIDGFDVVDAKGKVFKSAASNAPGLLRAIASNETIATFDELTQDALLQRCLAADEKCGFNKAAKKDAMVDWLTARADAPVAPTADVEDALGEIELEEVAA